MGLEKIISANGKTRILIFPIQDWEYYSPLLPDSERTYLERFGSMDRRAAGAAWRMALHRELGHEIALDYDAAGAPFVKGTGTELYIGVSHSAGRGAVIISDSKCAIDIEDAERDFSRAADRFVSEAEAGLAGSSEPLFLPAVWCAKETLYKISGRTGLDMKKDLRITRIDLAANNITGAIRDSDGRWEPYGMKILYHKECIVVYCH